MTDHPAPPSDELTDRLDALGRVVEIGAGRLPQAAMESATRLLEQAKTRRGLSADHTVVALAGATGSGKSSLFNALSGIDLSSVGVRRPTTGAVHACVWGMPGAGGLLDWLGVPEGHRVARDTVLDTAPSPLAGLVLLDLPDHDSADESHRSEVDRLVGLVDVLVWVMDPQKYADRVVHEEFLQPMSAHSDVVVVALNQVDRLDGDGIEACRVDLRRLLAADGLERARLVTTSTATEPGVEQLQAALVGIVQSRQAPSQRLLADVSAACAQLRAYWDPQRAVAGVDSAGREQLLSEIVDSSGVTTLGHAVTEATRRRGLAYISWPIAWLAARLRRSPSLRLPSGGELTGLAAEQAPAVVPLPLAQIDGALRAVSDASSRGLPPPWPTLVRGAGRARADELVDAIDRVLRATDVAAVKVPVWWWLFRVVQWLSLLGVIVGSVLLGVGLVGAGVGVVLPAMLAGGSLVLGLGLDLVGRAGVANVARQRGDELVAALRDEIASCVREHVLEPLESELDAYAGVGRELAVACRVAGTGRR